MLVVATGAPRAACSASCSAHTLDHARRFVSNWEQGQTGGR
jgi:hypothetical protein